ncbi:uncharacterized protein DS421_17g596710 [Arachis hypogaea]|nr:uncharacterized protein DS421_17g596710 [Arachis hypogaea]
MRSIDCLLLNHVESLQNLYGLRFGILLIYLLCSNSAVVVREAAACNLAMLLPLFPDMDKYFKVEELMFQLVCDPLGVVVETSLKELVPALSSSFWG